jgi:hypothetical protein
MIKYIQGKCKIFEFDGDSFICDARYRISVQTGSSGYQDNAGSLYDIDLSILPSLIGKEGILELEDGQELKFAASGLDMVQERLDIRINSVVAL